MSGTGRFWTPPRLTVRFWWGVLAWVAAVGLGHAIDEPAWRLAYDADIERHDWYQMFRAMGYMPAWVLIAGAVLAAGWAGGRRPTGFRAGWWRPGVGIGASALAAGGLAELLKVFIGRERPAVIEGSVKVYQGYVFKDWSPSQGVLGALTDGSNLGFPSSHTAVAFAGAIAFGRAFPGSGWVLGVVALGCAWTRMLAGAHFLTDVLGGLAFGYACAWLIVRPADIGRDRILER